MENDTKDLPNPGSRGAIELGCRCAIFDNNHGKYPPWPGSWWINADCPVHGSDLPLSDP